MRVIVTVSAIVGVAALLAGCGPKTGKPAQADASGREAVQANGCADGLSRLEGTGLCQDEAKSFLVLNPQIRTPELPDCTWVVGETMMPVDEALLYYTAVCKGVETKLGFSGGAKSAEIAYERSALFGDAAKGRVIIRLFGTDPDPQGALKAAIAEAPEAERATCEIRPANYEGWPPDALLIAPNAEARAEYPKDEPLAACGPMGIDEDQTTYWRIRQGYAWWFDLGQEDPDFDAGNMTIIVKGADGVWSVKP
jgi:hypothetical protein